MRHRDWLPRLLNYVESVRKIPFDPVRHNCGLFVAGAIREMLGDDPVRRLGLELDSERDIARALINGGGLKGLFSQYAGEMLPPRLARRGDAVIKKGVDGDTLGICMGTHALFLAEDGLQKRELTECEGCWRI